MQIATNVPAGVITNGQTIRNDGAGPDERASIGH
jgi:hypothetical protein